MHLRRISECGLGLAVGQVTDDTADIEASWQPGVCCHCAAQRGLLGVLARKMAVASLSRSPGSLPVY
jgi:hypothetical protein